MGLISLGVLWEAFNKLVNDATNSIIEKTCLDEIDIKRRKLDDTTNENLIQEGHDATTNGNTQSKYYIYDIIDWLQIA